MHAGGAVDQTTNLPIRRRPLLVLPPELQPLGSMSESPPLSKFTKQIAPPVKNGHAPPPTIKSAVSWWCMQCFGGFTPQDTPARRLEEPGVEPPT